jgi:hypothetical protein
VMGYTPIDPRQRKPPPPPAPPRSRTAVVDPGRVDLAPAPAVSRRKCGYCGTWNDGTRCTGCGAPVDWAEPNPLARPFLDFPLNRVVR